MSEKVESVFDKQVMNIFDLFVNDSKFYDVFGLLKNPCQRVKELYNNLKTR